MNRSKKLLGLIEKKPFKPLLIFDPEQPEKDIYQLNPKRKWPSRKPWKTDKEKEKVNK